MSAAADFDQSFDEVFEEHLRLGCRIGDDDGPGTVDGWDSLAHVRLIHALETRFAVRLPDEALLEEQSAGSLRAMIRERL